MGLTINTNIGSMILLNHLGVATQGLNDAIESMTSGYKVNHAKDNAANFGIVTNMTTRINSLQIREDNASLGLELVSTASSGIESITNHLQKIRSLAMSTVNGTYGNTSLTALQQELKSRLDEIKRTTDSLTFENRKIFEKQEPITKSAKSARAPKANTQTITSAADKDTTFEQLGITDLSLDLYNSSGAKVNSFTLDSGDKIDKLLTVLNSFGFNATISSGVISISSPNGNYIKGGLADALGITTTTKTLITNTTSSSNNKISYTTTAFADKTTSFAKAGLNIAGKTLKIKSKTDNSELGTITVDNNSETFQDLFDALSNYGIGASIKDGKITISSSDKYITGDVATILGITTSYTNTTITTGQSTTSSNPIQYTITSNATSSNTLADLGIADSSLVIENNTGTALKTINVTSTTSLGDLFQTLATNSVTASITDGVISISGDNIISGALAEALGVGKVVTEEGIKTTTGIDYTSGSVCVTITTNFHDNELVSSLDMPEKDTLLTAVDYIDASACEDICDVHHFTSNTTYKITSTSGFTIFATLVNNGESGIDSTFVLMNDVDFSFYPVWNPIGNNKSPFKGHFYGNGHIISNLNIDASYSDYTGLFGKASYADVRDLIIKNTTINLNRSEEEYAFKYVGILAADIDRVRNISVSGSINILGESPASVYVGGVAERCSNIDTANVNVDIIYENIDSYSSRVGGILASSPSSAFRPLSISNCYVSGSIKDGSGNFVGSAILASDFCVSDKIFNNFSKMYANDFINLDESTKSPPCGQIYSNKFMNCKNNLDKNVVRLGEFWQLRECGIEEPQTIIIYKNKSQKTITVNPTDTIYNIYNNLLRESIKASYTSYGGFSITAGNEGCIIDVSDALRNILHLEAGEGKTYEIHKWSSDKYANSSSNTIIHKNLQNLTASSKLSDIGIVSDKTITVSQNGILKTVTVKSTDTVDNLTAKLSKVGITATLANGKLTFSGSNNSFIKDMSSELATAFGVSVGKGNTYGETTQTSYTNNQSNNTYKSTSTQVLSTSSMLNQLKNVTSGAIRVCSSSGALGTINVSGTNTIQEFFNKIKNYGITGSITDGKVTLASNGDSYLESISGGSNLLSVLGMGAVNQTKSAVTEHSPSKKLIYEKSLDDWTMYDVDIAIGGISNDADYKIGLNLNFGINYALDITTKSGAEKALSEVDRMLQYLLRSQSDIGSTQNRLLSVLDEISVQYENLVSSRSTLRDADIAKVSSKYLRNQIMQQAATTLLSVANQNPSIALGLI